MLWLMGMRLVAFMMFVSTAVLATADSKGYCPPTPPKPNVVGTKTSAPQTPPTPDAQYAGTVMLMAVISDTGYVCDAQVIRGLDKETDKRPAGAVRQWHFQPSRKHGHTVPVVVTVEVNCWRKNGELVQFPATPTLTQTQDESTH
jgi:Gram-negative bacterial TonB protein C-terminal